MNTTKHKDILMIVNSVANEKDIPKETIFVALEDAIAYVTTNKMENDVLIRVEIDRKTGEYSTKRVWIIAEDSAEDFNVDRNMKLSTALSYNDQLTPGDEIEEPIESIEFGRIASQQAKQFIMRAVRDAERIKLATEFESKIGQVIIANVKRVTRDSITLDHKMVEASLKRNQDCIPKEIIRVGDQVRVVITSINDKGRGPLLNVSRTHPNLLVELFRSEVPEIFEGSVTIKNAARDPGARSKIAVKANDSRIDPIGACIGVRGSRVQAVSNELAGERVDIILWDDSPAQMAINAIAPAQIEFITMNESDKSMDLAVQDDQLAIAIGKNGQNIKLASELLNWTLNVLTVDQANSKAEEDIVLDLNYFTESLEVDEDIAKILIREGFKSTKDIINGHENLMKIPEFNEDIATQLVQNARLTMISESLNEQEDSLSNLEHMTASIKNALEKKGISTCSELADLAVDELTDIPGITDKIAAKIIMEARKPWFNDENKDSNE